VRRQETVKTSANAWNAKEQHAVYYSVLTAARLVSLSKQTLDVTSLRYTLVARYFRGDNTLATVRETYVGSLYKAAIKTIIYPLHEHLNAPLLLNKF
jgi:hypothetical protein